MKSSPAVMRVDSSEAGVEAARRAEQKLFEHYGLDYRVTVLEHKETGARFRVLEAGSGQPVLMVPGGAGDTFHFVPLMAGIPGYRFIAVNRPGGGMSDAVDHRHVDMRSFAVSVLQTTLDAFGLSSVPVICNSMGGYWTLNLALRHPERVSKMVQLGCPALLLDTSAPFFMRLLSVPGINRLIVPLMKPPNAQKAGEGLKQMGSRKEAIDALPVALAEATYRFFNLPTYGFTWISLVSEVVTLRGGKPHYQFTAEQMRSIQQPVQFIWGDRDPFGGLDVARKATEILPDARLREMQAGHLPHLDDPAACAATITEFLGGSGSR